METRGSHLKDLVILLKGEQGIRHRARKMCLRILVIHLLLQATPIQHLGILHQEQMFLHRDIHYRILGTLKPLAIPHKVEGFLLHPMDYNLVKIEGLVKWVSQLELPVWLVLLLHLVFLVEKNKMHGGGGGGGIGGMIQSALGGSSHGGGGTGGLAGMAGAALGGNMGGHGMGGHGMGGHGMGGPLGHSMGGGSKMSKKAKKAAKYGLPIAAVVGGGYMAGKAFGHRGGGSSSSSGSDSD